MIARSHWRRRLLRGAPLPALRSWLLETGSLTARCQRMATTFRVRLLSYRLGKPLPDEAAWLGPAHLPAHVREVLLECDGVPVIFAHTMLSTAGHGRLSRWLARLGNRSLGSVLFTHPGFQRGPLEFIRVDRRHPLFARAVSAAALNDPPAVLWARRSVHALDGQAVLVTEVFLPAILAH